MHNIKLLWGLAALAMATPQAYGDNSVEVNKPTIRLATLSIEASKWDEETARDPDFVQEKGGKIRLGLSKGNDLTAMQGSYYNASHQFMLGYMRYKGGVLDHSTDLHTNVSYTGYNYRRDTGYRFLMSEKHLLSAKAIVGVDSWSRSILPKKVKSEKTGEVVEASAFEAYVRGIVGVGAEYAYQISPQKRIAVGLEKQIPIYTLEWNRSGGFHEPRSEWGTRAYVTYSDLQANPYFVSVYYNEQDLGKSDVNSKGRYQPDSQEKSIGITIGRGI